MRGFTWTNEEWWGSSKLLHQMLLRYGAQINRREWSRIRKCYRTFLIIRQEDISLMQLRHISKMLLFRRSILSFKFPIFSIQNSILKCCNFLENALLKKGFRQIVATTTQNTNISIRCKTTNLGMYQSCTRGAT